MDLLKSDHYALLLPPKFYFIKFMPIKQQELGYNIK